MRPPKTAQDLARLCRSLDGKGYKGYKALEGEWTFDTFALHIEHVQGDPFAAPTRVRVLVLPNVAGFPLVAFKNRSRATGTACFLARALGTAARKAAGKAGSGKSGQIDVEMPGQQVLPQTTVQVDDFGAVEARFGVGLPAKGRRILGEEAARLLTGTVPELVVGTLLAAAHSKEELIRHAETNEDAEHLRKSLEKHNLIAFIPEGAFLPRRSGVDDSPLDRHAAVPFHVGENLRVTLEAPNVGPLTGMGIPAGVTLIVGGGFHGKSTLLRALQTGVYNHRPGDGREYVVAHRDAVKIRAEDGRAVTRVDIACFIDGLPGGEDTYGFSTSNASGSTSQAAAISEALDSGARVLLMDEDTCATNFMIRDRRMQALVPREVEPIVPLVDRVRDLYNALDVSTVLVLGGSGDYLDVAHTVIAMHRYEPRDVTEAAGAVAREHPTGRTPEWAPLIRAPYLRAVERGCLNPSRGRRDILVKAPDLRTLVFGRDTVDLAAVEQIVARGQVRALGQALAAAAHLLEKKPLSVPDLLDAIEEIVADGGLDALDARHPGDLTAFRRHELAAALNRLRSLRIV